MCSGNKTKVLHFASSYFPRIGGIPFSVRDIARQTCSEIDHSLVCRNAFRAGRSWEYAPAGLDESDPAIKVMRVQTIDGAVFDGEIRRFIKRGGYDVFCPHTMAPRIMEAVRCVPEQKKVICFSRYGTDLHVSRDIIERVDLWITWLPRYKQALVDRHGISPEKVSVVPEPVDTDIFQYRSKNYGKKLLYVGRIAPEKRVEMLVPVLGYLRNMNYTLTICGDYDHADRDMIPLQQVIENNCVPVFFDKTFSERRLSDIYHEHDIVISASRRETFCEVFQQAIACGLPVITTADGPVRDWATPYVRFVRSVWEICSSILMHDYRMPERNDMQWCSWSKNRKKFIELLRG